MGHVVESHLVERVVRNAGALAVKITIVLKHHRGDGFSRRTGWEATIVFVQWVGEATGTVAEIKYPRVFEHMADLRGLVARFDDLRVHDLIDPLCATSHPSHPPDLVNRPIAAALASIDAELAELGTIPDTAP